MYVRLGFEKGEEKLSQEAVKGFFFWKTKKTNCRRPIEQSNVVGANAVHGVDPFLAEMPHLIFQRTTQTR